jgi:hypothetical protein
MGKVQRQLRHAKAPRGEGAKDCNGNGFVRLVVQLNEALRVPICVDARKPTA